MQCIWTVALTIAFVYIISVLISKWSLFIQKKFISAKISWGISAPLPNSTVRPLKCHKLLCTPVPAFLSRSVGAVLIVIWGSPACQLEQSCLSVGAVLLVSLSSPACQLGHSWLSDRAVLLVNWGSLPRQIGQSYSSVRAVACQLPVS
jgi:hypothetical protein